MDDDDAFLYGDEGSNAVTPTNNSNIVQEKSAATATTRPVGGSAGMPSVDQESAGSDGDEGDDGNDGDDGDESEDDSDSVSQLRCSISLAGNVQLIPQRVHLPTFIARI